MALMRAGTLARTPDRVTQVIEEKVLAASAVCVPRGRMWHAACVRLSHPAPARQRPWG
jgi:hypothetical protein